VKGCREKAPKEKPINRHRVSKVKRNSDMATVQHLEKLRHIQRMFAYEEGLEAAVAGERLSHVLGRTETLIRQRAFLREERRRLRVGAERVTERQAALKTMQRKDWIAASVPAAMAEPHVRICIGGLMFEASHSVLKRDPTSLLAQLCSPTPPILPDPAGGFFIFDRDWWLFRYLMSFLRDGFLPSDRNLLAQLYREAAFWHLGEMQRAIEEEKLHLRPEHLSDNQKGNDYYESKNVRSSSSSSSSSGNSSSSSSGRSSNSGSGSSESAKTESRWKGDERGDKGKEWWRKAPSWLTAVDEAQKEKVSADKKKSDKEKDWWTSTTYKGRDFLPLSSSPDKVTSKAGYKDAKPTTAGVWGSRSRRDSDDEYADDIRGSYGGGRGGDWMRSSYQSFDERMLREQSRGGYGNGYGYDNGRTSSSSSNYNSQLPPSRIAGVGGGGSMGESLTQAQKVTSSVDMSAIERAQAALKSFQSAAATAV